MDETTDNGGLPESPFTPLDTLGIALEHTIMSFSAVNDIYAEQVIAAMLLMSEYKVPVEEVVKRVIEPFQQRLRVEVARIEAQNGLFGGAK